MSERRENSLADPTYVAEQYRDSSRLNARRRLYALYEPPGTPSFFSWLFDAIEFPPAARVLEVGCGSGNLWLESAGRIPAGLCAVLSDSSPAMVAAARGALDDERLRFEHFDVQQIPYPEAAFDLVIASHMLYHVEDRTRALAEIRRVLRPGGTLYATTNAWTHLIELRALTERFVPQAHVLPARYLPDAFDVENGARELQRFFPSLRVLNRRSELRITEASHLIDYVRSMLSEEESFDERKLREHLQWLIGVQGHVHLTVAAALFVAKR